MVYYPNDGAGGFGSEVVISNTIADPGQVVSGDIDKDGNLDLVVTSFTDNETIANYSLGILIINNLRPIFASLSGLLTPIISKNIQTPSN